MFLGRRKIKMFKKIKAYYLFFVITTFVFIAIPNNASESNSIISIGDKNTKVTVKVFSSLTCPHCAHFHNNVFKNLKRDFIDKGTLKFEHHGFPLDLAALNAEKIINCSNSVEKKLVFLNELYEKQSTWAVGSDINSINSKLTKMAKNYGLNDDKVKSCLNNEELEEEILNNRIEGHKKYRIKSTPTIFINEKKYEGNHEYESFKKAIEKLL
tara:strand:+ start:543 stop:1178 length:636 start_codon:yes stop_codon:yes gene_type:complete